MQNKIHAGVIGATGYAGVELVRLLLAHPNAELTAISSVSFEGKPVSSVYPALGGICDITCGTANQVIDKCDVVFAALPHGLSQDTALSCFEAGKKFIDLGADFRLENPSDYQKWYDTEYMHPQIHKKAVYGLCELFREDIKGAAVVGNPGCYPTASALGLAPALAAGMVKPRDIIIDAKSGVTGAGRGLSQGTHFPDCNEAFSAYKVAAHRHTPEIEQTLSKLASAPVGITFVPHLMPVNRGIFATIYAKMDGGFSMEQIRTQYEQFYADEHFVRVLPEGTAANVSHVRCSNYCELQIYQDMRAGLLIITSAIDNMVKGAAGQAVQNMNILYGFDEQTGLNMIPEIF